MGGGLTSSGLLVLGDPGFGDGQKLRLVGSPTLEVVSMWCVASGPLAPCDPGRPWSSVPCGGGSGLGLCLPVGGCCPGTGSQPFPAQTPGPPGRRSPGRVHQPPAVCAFDLRALAAGWLWGVPRPPARPAPPVTNSRTPRGLASHMVSALCPFPVLGEGRREQNRTSGGTSKVRVSDQKSVQVSH